MRATEMVHIRIDKRVKSQAAKALSAMGLSVSDAVRVLLTRVAAEKALPFDLKVPNPPQRQQSRKRALVVWRRSVTFPN